MFSLEVKTLNGVIRVTSIVVLALCGCAALAQAPTAQPTPDQTAREVLGCNIKNACLIDASNRFSATDLPGRLVVLSGSDTMPGDVWRQCYRKPNAKVTVNTDDAGKLPPIHVSLLDQTTASSISLFGWATAGMSKKDRVEFRTTPLPATVMSVEQLDEAAIARDWKSVPLAQRQGLGIILSVIPYEAFASLCREVSKPNSIGVWYIQANKSWYAKDSDEKRQYYMVAVYTPLVFLDDLGAGGGEQTHASNTTSTSTPTPDPFESLKSTPPDPSVVRAVLGEWWVNEHPQPFAAVRKVSGVDQ